MPRAARIIDPNGYYHITCRGNNRASVFHDPDDFIAYLNILRHCKKLFSFELFHYTLMTNHLHLLLRTIGTAPLSVVMKTLSQLYSLHYKRRYGTIGHLWQSRFYSRIITDDEYLLTCGAYIELNPVRARLVQRPIDYRWSSARHYVLGHHNDLIDTDPLYSMLAPNDVDRRAAYLQLLTAQRTPFSEHDF